MKRNIAQTTIEYLIVWSMIIVLLLIGTSTFIRRAVEQATDSVVNVLNQEIKEELQEWDR